MYTNIYMYVCRILGTIFHDTWQSTELYTSGFYNLNPAFINLNTIVFNYYPLEGYLECYTIWRNS